MIGHWRRWAWVALATLLCIAFLRFCVRIIPADENVSSPVPVTKPEREIAALVLPVQGVSRAALIDTFSQARAEGARVHDAIDIMAPAGTPVVAAAAGRIEKLFWSRDGGRTVYQRSRDARRVYYYAHLQEYAPGLREGQWLAQGQRIGTVGSTGNADPSAPHLHFAVHVMRAGEPWHGGRAVNPYLLLTQAR